METSGDLRGSWDPDRLAQAFTNLVSNAVQHGAAASPVRIRARGSSQGAEVSIHNMGPFMPRERLARLFDGMTQAPNDGPRDKRHLGLGLYIVDRIVSAHGGTIDVTSQQDEGTTFVVHLPRNAPPANV